MNTLYDVWLIINDGEKVVFRIEAATKSEAISVALSMLDPGDVVQDICAARFFGCAA